MIQRNFLKLYSYTDTKKFQIVVLFRWDNKICYAVAVDGGRQHSSPSAALVCPLYDGYCLPPA